MALQIVAWDDTKKRLKRTTSDPAAVGVATRSQRTALTNGTTSVAITFSSAMANTSYSLTCTLQNTADANPQFQPITITALSTTGFTAQWNVALDSGNYFLNYLAIAFI